MKFEKASVCARRRVAELCAVAIVFLTTVTNHAFASHAVEHLIYTFDEKTESYQPNGGLIADSAGNLYGSTVGYGASGVGTVFKLSPPATPGGAWTDTVLHNFPASSEDGQNPWAGLTLDSKGNLYGTTIYSHNFTGGGTVFELSPQLENKSKGD